MTMKRLLQNKPCKVLLDAPESEPVDPPEPLGGTVWTQSETTKHIISCLSVISLTIYIYMLMNQFCLSNLIQVNKKLKSLVAH